MAGAYMVLFDRSLRRQRVFRDRADILGNHDDKSLIERYRLPRHMILEVLDAIEARISSTTHRSHAVSPVVQLLATLRFFSKGGFLSETGDLHGISRASVCRFTDKVTRAIVETFREELAFPNDVASMKEGFHCIAAFPNVVGAIDGTLVPIKAPSVDEHVYVCRKGYHALNVQGIVDNNCRFINIVVRWPGSVHDSFILNNSSISTAFERGNIDGWLLGDSGYPLRPWLMTPVATPTTQSEERYNRSHKKTRNVVERAFGVLKSRFRCLHKSAGHLMSSPERCCRTVTACAVLHNMCVARGVPAPDDTAVEEDPPFQYNGPLNDGIATRRALIMNRFS